MIEPNTTQNLFKPQFKLDDRERSLLVAATSQEWWDVLQRIMEEEIRLLNIHLMNLGTDSDILTAHRLVKGASMFYSGVMDRIKELTAVEKYIKSGVGTIENPERPTFMDEFAGQ